GVRDSDPLCGVIKPGRYGGVTVACTFTREVAVLMTCANTPLPRCHSNSQLA
ncbi:hypothetical protein JYU34_013421, partial [Plutella xylostella]